MSAPDAVAEFRYTGGDNLEIMAEAENYNAFLTDLVLAHCGGARRVLDFGAGNGTFARRLRERGLDVTCLELDAGQAESLRSQGFATCESIGAVADGTFDAIYSLNVLEHIRDDGAEARQLHRVLAPGGVLFCYVPAFQVLFGTMDRKVGHHRRYTRATLEQVFRSAGFAIERNRYADSIGFLATLVFNLVDRGDGTLNREALKLYDRLAFPVSRALDAIVWRWFGKNVYVAARKPAA